MIARIIDYPGSLRLIDTMSIMIILRQHTTRIKLDNGSNRAIDPVMSSPQDIIQSLSNSGHMWRFFGLYREMESARTFLQNVDFPILQECKRNFSMGIYPECKSNFINSQYSLLTNDKKECKMYITSIE